MACVFCGNENGKITRVGLNGEVCTKCNEQLNNLYKTGSDEALAAASYFDQYADSAKMGALNYKDSIIKNRSSEETVTKHKEMNTSQAPSNSSYTHTETIRSIDSERIEKIETDVKTIKTIAIIFLSVLIVSFILSIYSTVKIVGYVNSVQKAYESIYDDYDSDDYDF